MYFYSIWRRELCLGFALGRWVRGKNVPFLHQFWMFLTRRIAIGFVFGLLQSDLVVVVMLGARLLGVR